MFIERLQSGRGRGISCRSASAGPSEQVEQGILEAWHLHGEVRRGPLPPRTRAAPDVGDIGRSPLIVTAARRGWTLGTPSSRPQPGRSSAAAGSGQGERIVAGPAWRATSSAGRPASRTRPARITTTRSHSPSASSISWVTSSTVVPSLAQLAHGRPHVAACRRVQALGQLVEDHQPRAVDQGEHQEQPLALPAAERGERRAAPLGQPELLEQLAAVAGQPVANSSTASPTRNRSGSAESCSWLPTSGRNPFGLGHGVEAEDPQRPASGRRRPWMHSTVVVLPAPLAPTSPTISPARTSRSRPSTTTLSPYTLRRPRTVTTCGLVIRSIVPTPRLPSRVSPRLEPRLYPRVDNPWPSGNAALLYRWYSRIPMVYRDARRALIDAAVEIIARGGVEAATTREIYLQAGVTAPTLYHHFGDKQGLLDAVVTDAFERYLARKRALRPTGDPATDIRRGWDAHVEFARANPALYRLMWPAGRTDRRRPRPRAPGICGTVREAGQPGRLGARHHAPARGPCPRGRAERSHRGDHPRSRRPRQCQPLGRRQGRRDRSPARAGHPATGGEEQ